MPSKEFTFGFVLSAAMNSSFASSFAKASREVDELRKYMDKLGEETQQLQKLSERESLMRKHSIPQLCKRIRKAFLHGKCLHGYVPLRFRRLEYHVLQCTGFCRSIWKADAGRHTV